MASKNQSKFADETGVRVFRRGLPLVIQDGRVDESLIQIVHHISGLFAHFEHQGKVPVQASIELTIILQDK